MSSLRTRALRSVTVSRYIAKPLKREVPKMKPKDAVLTPSSDVFLNHRGVDTKHTIASLLYDRLVQKNIRPFLDNRTMQPGDKLYEKINAAIDECKVGVTIFSPSYCDSCFCLHELAKLVEGKKKIIPIFYDIRPSQLILADVKCGPIFTPKEIERFKMALQEAKYTVGLTFDSRTGLVYIYK
jgi:TIR domain